MATKTNALNAVLSDYENLIIGGEPTLERERTRDMKRLRESVEIMRMVCQRLVNTEQPNPRQRCGYCQARKGA